MLNSFKKTDVEKNTLKKYKNTYRWEIIPNMPKNVFTIIKIKKIGNNKKIK